MDKEDKQIIDRAVKENWRIGDRTRLKRLLEKNLKLYRENEELKLELTVEKDQHQEETNLHLHAEDYIKSLEQENNKLLDVINNQDVKIADLEKENAILKGRTEVFEKQILGLLYKYESVYKRFPDLKDAMNEAERVLKENAELKSEKGCETCTKFDKVQLTKAKEIIKDQKELLDRVLSGAETLSDFAQNTLHKAGQFLNKDSISEHIQRATHNYIG